MTRDGDDGDRSGKGVRNVPLVAVQPNIGRSQAPLSDVPVCHGCLRGGELLKEKRTDC